MFLGSPGPWCRLACPCWAPGWTCLNPLPGETGRLSWPRIGRAAGSTPFCTPILVATKPNSLPSSLRNQMQISPQIITEMSLKRARKQGLPTRWPQAGGLQCYSVTLEGTTRAVPVGNQRQGPQSVRLLAAMG